VTDTDHDPAVAPDRRPGRRIALDLRAADDGGRQVMTTAAALRARVSAADDPVAALLERWRGADAAALAAEWDTARDALGVCLDRLHLLGHGLRQVAATWRRHEDRAADMFRRPGRIRRPDDEEFWH
jgi:uncharacterized protein YukE